MASRDLVSLKNVTRYYAGGRIKAVAGVDLSIQKGDWLTITGPSGSGKSTLLNLICGVDHPSSGRIYFNGRQIDTTRSWPRIRCHFIGFVFQSFNLLPTLNALENVQIPMFGNGRPAGERQRVAIARALANEPDLILADEPTGNLDSGNATQILKLLKDIHRREGATIVLVTHDPVLAEIGDHRVLLTDGRIAREIRCQFEDPCCLSISP